MVDVRLWDARQVWYVHTAYRRKATVQGPFIVSSIGVETEMCMSGHRGFVRVYGDKRAGRMRTLPAHYCWPSENTAQKHAALLNERKS